MSDMPLCGNPDVLMSYLYEEDGPSERRAFETHLRTCEACAREVREFRAVRTGLAQWVPPDAVLDFRVVRDASATRSWRSWFALPAMPAWAQVGVAAMLVGMAVGISGLEVRYDTQGFTVRTGWHDAVPATSPAQAAARQGSQDEAPWRAELAALESRMRAELQGAPAAAAGTVPVSAPGRRTMSDAEFMARVGQLIEASETRQQRELALRLAQVVRDVDAQRRADLVRVADGLGVVEGRTGAEIARQRQMLDYVMRVSSQREPR